ncbi:L,D-transpeptidase family protein [Marivirga sp. S37H4]|uniref:L,D-transpeptidase family protein n=1 Tax=Marivirga aurantiaca TaxID=2802615 RepID=A0A934WVE2_9BACT|nr:L,D-transpeptidase family protein [Marivirga aurantiaca]MBK6263744.1 L,D-transpeptidase family protein [Marivirga aurantiaca]
MNKIAILIILGTSLSALVSPTDFLTEQKRYQRVRTSIADKEQLISEKLLKNGLALDNLNILIIAYKEEDQLELYAKKKDELTYQKLITYDVCAKSGQAGPKRKQGDYQVPEGFYHVDRYNPASNFYLSLGINYPNLSDKRKSKADNLGGDIFIHGSCVTIGCLPMTTDKIKEIYLYAIHARNNGQMKIPVYIFPFKMTNQNFNTYKNRYSNNKELLDFWANLKTGYDIFSREKKELKVTVEADGDYVF